VTKYIENFVGKLKGKRSLGRPKRKWEVNTRINLRENTVGK
jgi:hypothetical protein